MSQENIKKLRKLEQAADLHADPLRHEFETKLKNLAEFSAIELVADFLADLEESADETANPFDDMALNLITTRFIAFVEKRYNLKV